MEHLPNTEQGNSSTCMKMFQEDKELTAILKCRRLQVSRTTQLEGDYDSLQRELQAATQRALDYERSNVKLEEKLQQLEQNLRSHGMVRNSKLIQPYFHFHSCIFKL